jgi:hypothetical protein
MNGADIDKICIAPNSLDAFCQILQFRCKTPAYFLVKIMKKEPVHDLYQVTTTRGNSHKAEPKIRIRADKA